MCYADQKGGLTSLRSPRCSKPQSSVREFFRASVCLRQDPGSLVLVLRALWDRSPVVYVYVYGPVGLTVLTRFGPNRVVYVAEQKTISSISSEGLSTKEPCTAVLALFVPQPTPLRFAACRQTTRRLSPS